MPYHLVLPVLFCLLLDCDWMSDENVKLLCDNFYLGVPSPGFDPVIFRLGSKYANCSAKVPRLSMELQVIGRSTNGTDQLAPKRNGFCE